MKNVCTKLETEGDDLVFGSSGAWKIENDSSEKPLDLLSFAVLSYNS